MRKAAEQAPLYKKQDGERSDEFLHHAGVFPEFSGRAAPTCFRRMASPKLLRGRNSSIGAIYAVTTITEAREPLFLEPDLAEIVRSEIDCSDGRALIQTHAWIAMPDHVHWLFELRTSSLGRCVQAFKSRSARAINLVTGSHGPIWQSGFYDHRLRDDEDLLQQARYLVMNPVRGGLTERIEDYPFWWCRWLNRSADF